jgi:hypothetical protein
MSTESQFGKMRQPFDPARDVLSEDEKLRALMEFDRVFDSTIDKHLHAVNMEDGRYNLWLVVIERDAYGRLDSVLDIYLGVPASGSGRDKKIQMREMLNRAGNLRSAIYYADHESNNVSRYDDDQVFMGSSEGTSPGKVDSFRLLDVLQEKFQNQALAADMGYNDQPVNVHEIVNLDALLEFAEPRLLKRNVI